jgi:hypothetical protein
LHLRLDCLAASSLLPLSLLRHLQGLAQTVVRDLSIRSAAPAFLRFSPSSSSICSSRASFFGEPFLLLKVN